MLVAISVFSGLLAWNLAARQNVQSAPHSYHAEKYMFFPLFREFFRVTLGRTERTGRKRESIMNSNLSRMSAALVLTIFASAAWAEGIIPVVCIAPPKAQLGQGNNSATDVSEPVRTALSQYMAGPSVQLVPLEARIPVQIEAEASQKNCNFVLLTSVTQTKKSSKTGFLKALAPIAGAAFPMLGGMGGNVSGMMAGQVATSVMSASAAASAESMQQDYMAAMMGAQQTNVKSGDTLTVEYSLSGTGSVGAGKPESLQSKAKQDGEDVIGPLLEQVAVAVLSVVTAA